MASRRFHASAIPRPALAVATPAKNWSAQREKSVKAEVPD